MQRSQGFSRFAVLGITLSLLPALDGCSSSTLPASSDGGSSGSGGAMSSGGAAGAKTGQGGVSSGGTSAGGGPGNNGGSGGAGVACSNESPCAGDVVGAWTTTTSCLDVSGELDLSLVGAGCPSAPVTGSLQVNGTFTATANGKYVDDTTTTGTERLTLDPSCLIISSTPVTCAGAANLLGSVLGYSSLTCTSAAGGGCDCSATVKQVGGLGLLAINQMTSGKYKTSGTLLTLTGETDDTSYSYCVAGNKLTVVPQSTTPNVKGTITLQKSNGAGSGGTSGTATGGASGSGGQVASGGIRGTGGATGSGGAGGTTALGGAGGGPSTGGASGSGGASATGGSTTIGTTAPCDIYAQADTPCVAAHSVVRALYGAYNGKLYQVRRASDNSTKDILPLAAGGIADTAPEDTFCAGSTCVLTVVYDQTGKGNDLWYQGSDQVPASKSSSPAKATSDPATVNGHKIYSVYINPGNCYWHDGSKSGMPTGAQPEGMYMVTSSRHANSGCCFDYGNSETDRSADGAGAMDAINLSTTTAWGTGAGSGPWVMADLEYGLFAQGDNKNNPKDPTQTAAFVTAVLKNNGTTEYAIKGGDATTGSLSTYYKGALPGGWSPMKKQGALILGCGGDCCKPSGGANASSGIFYEGAIVSGYPTDATETAIQANIVAAGYGK